MAKKRKNPSASSHALQMTKTDDGYEIADEVTGMVYELPGNDEIHRSAVEICADYEWPKALEILKRCTLEFELVNEKNVYQNSVGVIVFAKKEDANELEEDWDTYCYVMSAIGEACTTIHLEHDRIEISN